MEKRRAIMKKKSLKMLIALVAVAVVSMGITFAYLNSTTETKTNTFSSNKELKVELREATWDGYEFGSETIPDGLTANPAITGEAADALGVNLAKAYVPGQVIPKNPTVKNTGDSTDGVDEYVAIKVQYYIESTQVSYTAFKDSLLTTTGIVFDSNWTTLSGASTNTLDQVYIYGTETTPIVLSNGTETSSLFTEVPLGMQIGTTDGVLPTFDIQVTAYAVQATGDTATLVDALKTLVSNH